MPKTIGFPAITYTCYICQVIYIHTLTYAIVCSTKGNVFKITFLPQDRFTARTLEHHSLSVSCSQTQRGTKRQSCSYLPFPPHSHSWGRLGRVRVCSRAFHASSPTDNHCNYKLTSPHPKLKHIFAAIFSPQDACPILEIFLYCLDWYAAFFWR